MSMTPPCHSRPSPIPNVKNAAKMKAIERIVLLSFGFLRENHDSHARTIERDTRHQMTVVQLLQLATSSFVSDNLLSVLGRLLRHFLKLSQR